MPDDLFEYVYLAEQVFGVTAAKAVEEAKQRAEAAKVGIDAVTEAAAKAVAEATNRRAALASTFDDGDVSNCSEDSGPAEAVHVRVPTFEKVKAYTGTRLGMIFKFGLAGLG